MHIFDHGEFGWKLMQAAGEPWRGGDLANGHDGCVRGVLLSANGR